MEGSVLIRDEERKELRTIVSGPKLRTEIKQSKNKVTFELQRNHKKRGENNDSRRIY